MAKAPNRGLFWALLLMFTGVLGPRLFAQAQDCCAIVDGVLLSCSSCQPRTSILLIYPIDSVAPNAFENNTQLVSLTLGDSRFFGLSTFTSLPLGLFGPLVNLTTLQIGSSQLQSLPAGIFDNNTQLQRLEIARANLTSLPDGLFRNLSSLLWLDLSGSKFSTLPPGAFDGLSRLTDLSLRRNDQLSTLPAGIFDDLTALQRLGLDSCALSSLPAGVFDRLVALDNFHFYWNPLGSLPPQPFAKLKNLKTLYFGSSTATSLPSDLFTGLSSLTALYFVNNPVLTALPSGLFDPMPSLNTLSVENNPMVASVGAGLLDKQTAVQYLKLLVGPVPQFPPGLFGKLSSLKHLSFASSAVTSFRADIFSGLSSMTIVGFDGCSQLNDLPESVFDGLPMLQEIVASSCNLTALPARLFQGPAATLESVSLGGNGLTSIPQGLFANLTSLQRLYLHYNKISSIPAGAFDDLTKVDTLRLEQNPMLSALPPGLFDSGIATLREIHLGGTGLADSSCRRSFSNVTEIPPVCFAAPSPSMTPSPSASTAPRWATITHYSGPDTWLPELNRSAVLTETSEAWAQMPPAAWVWSVPIVYQGSREILVHAVNNVPCGVVTAATLNMALDDEGTIFCNGVKIDTLVNGFSSNWASSHSYDLKSYILPGRPNNVTFDVSNVSAKGGVIFLLTIEVELDQGASGSGGCVPSPSPSASPSFSPSSSASPSPSVSSLPYPRPLLEFNFDQADGGMAFFTGKAADPANSLVVGLPTRAQWAPDRFGRDNSSMRLPPATVNGGLVVTGPGAGGTTNVLPSGNSARSICSWFKSSGPPYPAASGLLGIADYGQFSYQQRFGLTLRPTQGVYIVGEGYDFDCTSVPPLLDGFWHHVCVTVSGPTATTGSTSDVRILTDGVFRCGASYVYQTASASILRIGSTQHNTGEPFFGDIDSVTIWDLALTDAQVLQIYNLQAPPPLSPSSSSSASPSPSATASASPSPSSNGLHGGEGGPGFEPITAAVAAVGLDSSVHTIVPYTRNGQSGHLIGGAFTAAGGTLLNCAAFFDGLTFFPLGSGLNVGFDDRVEAIAVSSPSRAYFGGTFTKAGGIAAAGLAVYDGTSFSALSASFSGRVAALASMSYGLVIGAIYRHESFSASTLLLYNGSMIAPIGNHFASVEDLLPLNATHLIALGGSGSPFICDGSTLVSLPFSGVRSANLYEGSVVLAGSFSSAGGLSCQNIVLYHPSNNTFQNFAVTAPDGFPTVGSGPIIGLALQGQDTWLATCNYTSDRYQFYRRSANGAAPITVEGSSCQGFIRVSAAFLGSDVLFGGNLAAIDSTPVGNLALLRADGSVRTFTFSPPSSGLAGANPSINDFAMAPSGETVLAGLFTHAGGTWASNVALLDGQGFSPLRDPSNGADGIDGTVFAVKMWSSFEIVLGGYFPTALSGTLKTNHLVRVDLQTGRFSALPSGSGIVGVDSSVRAMAVGTNGIYLGGWFATAGDYFSPGPALNGVALWNGSLIQPLLDPSTGLQIVSHNSYVIALAWMSGKGLFLGGSLYHPSVSGSVNLLLWNGTGVSVPPGTAGSSGPLYRLLVVGNTLIVSITFSQRAIRWNADGSSTLLAVRNPDGSVSDSFSDLAPSFELGEVLVATRVSRSPLSTCLGRVDSNLTLSLLPNGCLPGDITALLPMADGSILVGGQFGAVNGTIFNSLARYKGAFSVPSPSPSATASASPSPSSFSNALCNSPVLLSSGQTAVVPQGSAIAPLRGRFVRIGKEPPVPGSEAILNLHELEAFSASADGSLVNVALNAPVTQSSYYGQSDVNPTYLTNGVHEVVYSTSACECAHTAVGDSQPWMEVDLGASSPLVSTIVLWSRVSPDFTFVSRSWNMNVTLLDENRKVVAVWNTGEFTDDPRVFFAAVPSSCVPTPSVSASPSLSPSASPSPTPPGPLAPGLYPITVPIPADGLDGVVHAVAPYKQGVLVAGSFVTAGTMILNRAAYYDGSTFKPLGSGDPYYGFNQDATSMAVARPGRVFFGGVILGAHIVLYDDVSFAPIPTASDSSDNMPLGAMIAVGEDVVYSRCGFAFWGVKRSDGASAPSVLASTGQDCVIAIAAVNTTHLIFGFSSYAALFDGVGLTTIINSAVNAIGTYGSGGFLLGGAALTLYNPQSGSLDAVQFDSSTGPVKAIAVIGQETWLVTSASSTLSSGTTATVLRWSPATGSSRLTGITLTNYNGGYGLPLTMAPFLDGVVVGGSFSLVNGTRKNNLAFVSKTDVLPIVASASIVGVKTHVGSVSSNNVDARVEAFATVSDGTGSPLVVIAGGFDMAGGVPAKSVALFDGKQFSPLSSGSSSLNGVNGNIHAIAVNNSQIFLGGTFDSTDGALDAFDFVRYDLQTRRYHPIPGYARTNVNGYLRGYIYALVMTDHGLYAFTEGGPCIFDGQSLKPLTDSAGSTLMTSFSVIAAGWLKGKGIAAFGINNGFLFDGSRATSLKTSVDGFWITSVAATGNELLVGGVNSVGFLTNPFLSLFDGSRFVVAQGRDTIPGPVWALVTSPSGNGDVFMSYQPQSTYTMCAARWRRAEGVTVFSGSCVPGANTYRSIGALGLDTLLLGGSFFTLEFPERAYPLGATGGTVYNNIARYVIPPDPSPSPSPSPSLSLSPSLSPSTTESASLTPSSSVSPASLSSLRYVRVNGTAPDRCWQISLDCVGRPGYQIVEFKVRYNGSPDNCWTLGNQLMINPLTAGTYQAEELPPFTTFGLNRGGAVDLTLVVGLTSVDFFQTSTFLAGGKPLYVFLRRDGQGSLSNDLFSVVVKTTASVATTNLDVTVFPPPPASPSPSPSISRSLSLSASGSASGSASASVASSPSVSASATASPASPTVSPTATDSTSPSPSQSPSAAIDAPPSASSSPAAAVVNLPSSTPLPPRSPSASPSSLVKAEVIRLSSKEEKRGFPYGIPGLILRLEALPPRLSSPICGDASSTGGGGEPSALVVTEAFPLFSSVTLRLGISSYRLPDQAQPILISETDASGYGWTETVFRQYAKRLSCFVDALAGPSPLLLSPLVFKDRVTIEPLPSGSSAPFAVIIGEFEVNVTTLLSLNNSASHPWYELLPPSLAFTCVASALPTVVLGPSVVADNTAALDQALNSIVPQGTKSEELSANLALTGSGGVPVLLWRSQWPLPSSWAIAELPSGVAPPCQGQPSGSLCVESKSWFDRLLQGAQFLDSLSAGSGSASVTLSGSTVLIATAPAGGFPGLPFSRNGRSFQGTLSVEFGISGVKPSAIATDANGALLAFLSPSYDELCPPIAPSGAAAAVTAAKTSGSGNAGYVKTREPCAPIAMTMRIVPAKAPSTSLLLSLSSSVNSTAASSSSTTAAMSLLSPAVIQHARLESARAAICRAAGHPAFTSNSSSLSTLQPLSSTLALDSASPLELRRAGAAVCPPFCEVSALAEFSRESAARSRRLAVIDAADATASFSSLSQLTALVDGDSPVSDSFLNSARKALASSSSGSQIRYTKPCVAKADFPPGIVSLATICSNASDPRSRGDYKPLLCPWGEEGFCQPCFQGSLCVGGQAQWARPGWFLPSQDSTAFPTKCKAPSLERCVGWDAGEGKTVCGEGYGGFGCSSCLPGYFASSEAGGGCRSCPSVDLSQTAALIVPILIVGAAIIAVLIPVALLSIYLSKRSGGSAGGGLSRLLAFAISLYTGLQAVINVSREAPSNAPELVKGFFDGLRSLQGEGVGIPFACSGASPLVLPRAVLSIALALEISWLLVFCLWFFFLRSRVTNSAAAASAVAAENTVSRLWARIVAFGGRSDVLAVGRLTLLAASLLFGVTANMSLSMVSCIETELTLEQYLWLPNDGTTASEALGISLEAVKALSSADSVDVAEASVELQQFLSSVFTAKVLSQSNDVICFEGEHRATYKLAAAFLAVFTVGLPLLSFFLVRFLGIPMVMKATRVPAVLLVKGLPQVSMGGSLLEEVKAQLSGAAIGAEKALTATGEKKKGRLSSFFKGAGGGGGKKKADATAAADRGDDGQATANNPLTPWRGEEPLDSSDGGGSGVAGFCSRLKAFVLETLKERKEQQEEEEKRSWTSLALLTSTATPPVPLSPVTEYDVFLVLRALERRRQAMFVRGAPPRTSRQTFAMRRSVLTLAINKAGNPLLRGLGRTTGSDAKARQSTVADQKSSSAIAAGVLSGQISATGEEADAAGNSSPSSLRPSARRITVVFGAGKRFLPANWRVRSQLYFSYPKSLGLLQSESDASEGQATNRREETESIDALVAAAVRRQRRSEAALVAKAAGEPAPSPSPAAKPPAIGTAAEDDGNSSPSDSDKEAEKKKEATEDAAEAAVSAAASSLGSKLTFKQDTIEVPLCGCSCKRVCGGCCLSVYPPKAKTAEDAIDSSFGLRDPTLAAPISIFVAAGGEYRQGAFAAIHLNWLLVAAMSAQVLIPNQGSTAGALLFRGAALFLLCIGVVLWSAFVLRPDPPSRLWLAPVRNVINLLSGFGALYNGIAAAAAVTANGSATASSSSLDGFARFLAVIVAALCVLLPLVIVIAFLSTLSSGAQEEARNKAVAAEASVQEQKAVEERTVVAAAAQAAASAAAARKAAAASKKVFLDLDSSTASPSDDLKPVSNAFRAATRKSIVEPAFGAAGGAAGSSGAASTISTSASNNANHRRSFVGGPGGAMRLASSAQKVRDSVIKVKKAGPGTNSARSSAAAARASALSTGTAGAEEGGFASIVNALVSASSAAIRSSAGGSSSGDELTPSRAAGDRAGSFLFTSPAALALAAANAAVGGGAGAGAGTGAAGSTALGSTENPLLRRMTFRKPEGDEGDRDFVAVSLPGAAIRPGGGGPRASIAAQSLLASYGSTRKSGLLASSKSASKRTMTLGGLPFRMSLAPSAVGAVGDGDNTDEEGGGKTKEDAEKDEWGSSSSSSSSSSEDDGWSSTRKTKTKKKKASPKKPASESEDEEAEDEDKW